MIVLKKILIYLLSFILIIFIIPALLTRRTSPVNSNEKISNQEEQNDENQTQTSNQNEYNYNKYGTISLLHKKMGEVEQVNLDEYLCNVVSAEMPANYEIEALKAQAIVARTYTIYKILNKKHDTADICDDSTCCQAWISKDDRLARWEESQRESNWQKIVSAVNDTKGKIITYDDKPIDAFFHSNSGGVTEVPVNVWGGTGYPYLQSVETAGEDTYTQYSSEVVFTQEQLINKLKEDNDNIFKFEQNLYDVKFEIKKIINNNEYTPSKELEKLLDDIDLEERLEGLKDYYNSNSIKYNELLYKKPFNYIYKLFKLDAKNTFKIQVSEELQKVKMK